MGLDLTGLDVFQVKTPSSKPKATVSVDVTSAADSIFTCPTGKYWILKVYHVSNATRASYWSVTLIAGDVYVTSGTSNRSNGALYDIRINADETVVITDLSFVAADVVSKNLTYEEYDV